MTFIKGNDVELRVLQENEEEAKVWTQHVMNSNKHMEFVMTGSTPMRWFDVRDEWKREREKGAVLFGVWWNNICQAVDHWTFVGTCGAYSPREVYDSYESRFMIVDPNAVGKGVGLEVVKLLNEYCFMRLNTHRIWLGVSSINLRAIKTYLDASYKFEGRLVDDIYTNGAYYDVYRMAITRPEWSKVYENVQPMQKGKVT